MLKMRIKPKISGSNPRYITMPATGLHQRAKQNLNFENKAKNNISLPDNCLQRSNLASFFNPLPPNKKGTPDVCPY